MELESDTTPRTVFDKMRHSVRRRTTKEEVVSSLQESYPEGSECRLPFRVQSDVVNQLLFVRT